MEQGIICKEYYIGKFIYLKDMLDNRLANVSFGRFRNEKIVVWYSWDKAKGEFIRRRLSSVNPEWNRLCEIAQTRLRYEEQLALIKNNWNARYKGDLGKLSEGYKIIRNESSFFNSDYWYSLGNNTCDFKNDYPVYHNGLIMRSQFEADVADILESIGIEYKYDTKIIMPNRKIQYPDMAMNFPEYDRCGFVEVMGGLGSVKYISRNAEKIDSYISAGIYPNRDLAIIPGDQDYRPDHDTIRRIIGVIIDSIAKSHVVRR